MIDFEIAAINGAAATFEGKKMKWTSTKIRR